jgi:hypothetical protein
MLDEGRYGGTSAQPNRKIGAPMLERSIGSTDGGARGIHSEA